MTIEVSKKKERKIKFLRIFKIFTSIFNPKIFLINSYIIENYLYILITLSQKAKSVKSSKSS